MNTLGLWIEIFYNKQLFRALDFKKGVQISKISLEFVFELCSKIALRIDCLIYNRLQLKIKLAINCLIPNRFRVWDFWSKSVPQSIADYEFRPREFSVYSHILVAIDYKIRNRLLDLQSIAASKIWSFRFGTVWKSILRPFSIGFCERPITISTLILRY